MHLELYKHLKNNYKHMKPKTATISIIALSALLFTGCVNNDTSKEINTTDKNQIITQYADEIIYHKKVVNNMMYYSSSYGYISCINTKFKYLVWKIKVQKYSNWAMDTEFVISDKHNILAFSQPGVLTVLDINSGKLTWEFEHPDLTNETAPTFSKPVIDDEYIIIKVMDSYEYKLNIADGKIVSEKQI